MMRVATGAALLMASAPAFGCGAAAAGRDPAVVALPTVTPSATEPAGGSAAAPPASARPSLGCEATFPAAGMTWREKRVTRLDLRAVTSCQVQPMRRTHTTSFDATVLEVVGRTASKLKLDILDDVDDVQGWTSSPSLAGKHYVLAFAGGKGTDPSVSTPDGAPAPAEEAQRVRTLAPAGAVTGLDADLVARLSRSRELEGKAIAAASQWIQGAFEPALRDEMPQPPSATATLTSGTGITFDVSLSTGEGSSGMCHHWTTSARLSGELRLRPSDGALVSLHVKGQAEDTEATCPAGGSTAPHTCNRGEASFDVERACFAGTATP